VTPYQSHYGCISFQRDTLSKSLWLHQLSTRHLIKVIMVASAFWRRVSSEWRNIPLKSYLPIEEAEDGGNQETLRIERGYFNTRKITLTSLGHYSSLTSRVDLEVLEGLQSSRNLRMFQSCPTW
jgi:hypothetical protein